MNLKDGRFAVISDVHGNLQALEKTLKILKKEKITNIIFLGDAVGYGANPEECYKKLSETCQVMLIGNHEAMLIDSNQKKSNLCEESFQWTQQKVSSDFIKGLKKLPFEHKTEGVEFYHASPDNNLYKWDYLNKKEEIISAFEGEGKICFYGHTHRPRITIIGDRIQDIMIKKSRYFVVDTSTNRCLINPGSIGQQRDTKTDLSLVICEYDGQFLNARFIRSRYNSLKAYLSIRFYGCGINNANYLIREKWRKRLYESIGNWCQRLYR